MEKVFLPLFYTMSRFHLTRFAVPVRLQIFPSPFWRFQYRSPITRFYNISHPHPGLETLQVPVFFRSASVKLVTALMVLMFYLQSSCQPGGTRILNAFVPDLWHLPHVTGAINVTTGVSLIHAEIMMSKREVPNTGWRNRVVVKDNQI